MKKLFSKLAVFSALLLFLSSCGISYPVLTTDNPVGTRIGESSYKVILGIFISNGGDASIQSAAKNGGISKIATIDYEVEAGFFATRYKTIVTGE